MCLLAILYLWVFVLNFKSYFKEWSFLGIPTCFPVHLASVRLPCPPPPSVNLTLSHVGGRSWVQLIFFPFLFGSCVALEKAIFVQVGFFFFHFLSRSWSVLWMGDGRVSCPPLEEVSFASWQTKVSSGTWRGFSPLLQWQVTFALCLKGTQATGDSVPVSSSSQSLPYIQSF